jgi:hypothetical protein
VENHGLRRVHPPAILDLPILYGRYCFSDGRENRLQFVLRYSRVGCPSVLLRLLADDLYLPTLRILPSLGRVPPSWGLSSAVKVVTSKVVEVALRLAGR